MLRGPVVGRKNHYGSKSLRGTQVAALFYTLCESAKLVGVDLLAFLAPNPAHPLMRWLASDEQAAHPTVFVEYTAALGLVVLLVIALAVWRARLRANGWFWMFGIFTALALGPFVHIAGVNTHIPVSYTHLRAHETDSYLV